MEKLMKQVLAMSEEDRIAFAHGLLLNLEKQELIANWQFWEKDTIKELLEQDLDRDIDPSEVSKVIASLNAEWLTLAQKDWDAFTNTLSKHRNKVGLKKLRNK